MKRKLAIIGASELQLPLILEAKKNGYETHVFAWKAGDVGEKEADFFYPISIIEKDLILEKCLQIKPDGVVSIASDLAVVTVNYIANAMNLIGNPIEDIKATTNKFIMRERLSESGVKCPKYIKTNKSSIKLELEFPVIVKPTDRSGSRGVTKINTENELDEAINRAIGYSLENEAIIEEFIEGQEYSVEYISQNGEHNFLALTRKITTGSPNFVEIGHIQGETIDIELLNEIKRVIEKSLNSLNIKNGASHSEIMITRDKKIYIIEIGARMGGDCIGSDLVEISTGINFIKKIIDISVGKDIGNIKLRKDKIAVCRYIFNEEDLRALDSIDKKYIFRVGNIEKLDNRIIDESSKRFGFYILSIDNELKFENLIKLIF